jgi:hypothetical protein
MSADEIINHMARHFGPVDPLSLQEIVPVTGIAIHVIRPRSDEDEMILFTTGMSDRKQTVPKGQEEFQYTELMLRLPGDWPLERLEEPANFWPIEWLKKIAWYPHDNETWLGGPFPIIANGEPPEPLGKDTQLSCLLLLCETDKLNPIRCKSGRSVLVYSMVPLYSEERDLEIEEGLEALFARFAEHEVSFVLDPGRVNAAFSDDEEQG